MDLLTAALLVTVVGIMVVVWVREQRIWQTFHAAPGHRPDSAVRLYNELRRAGVRSRYKLVAAGFVPNIGRVGGAHHQTARVLVHRDDLRRAQQVVRASMRDKS